VISVLGVDDVVEPVTGKKITHLDFVMLTLDHFKKKKLYVLAAGTGMAIYYSRVVP
jgi:hypothetical protein